MKPPLLPVFVSGGMILRGVLALHCAPAAATAETTIYVNRYFEVRDHDQPVKYIWNDDTRLARVTGSLADTTRIQRLRLHPGWNLRSVAVGGSRLPLSGEGQGAGTIHAAYRWSDASREWLPVSTNEPLSAGSVVWLHAITNTTIALSGSYSDPTNRPVAAGGAFLPGSGLETLSLPAPDPVRTFWHYEPEIEGWQVRALALPEPGPTAPQVLAPGGAAFVNAGVPFDLQVPDRALRIRYYHQDHLGSSGVNTDMDGAPLEETAYYPFGVPRHEHRLQQLDEEYTFTQKERDRESRLQYFGRRYYSPAIGKWLSTDPLEEQGGSMNLYAYANQNPLKFHDPDGAEIDVKTSKSGGVTTHTITLTAVIEDTPEASKHQPRTREELEAFRGSLVNTIRDEYSYYDEKTKTRYVADPKIKVLGPGEKAGPKDHVFKLVGDYNMSGVGNTRFQRQEDGSKLRGMVMRIRVRALLDARSAEVRKSPLYKSAEGIAAHEFGHAAGLDDLETDQKNLMSHGRMHDSREIKVEQLRTIVKEFQKGHLNKRLE